MIWKIGPWRLANSARRRWVSLEKASRRPCISVKAGMLAAHSYPLAA